MALSKESKHCGGCKVPCRKDKEKTKAEEEDSGKRKRGIVHRICKGRLLPVVVVVLFLLFYCGARLCQYNVRAWVPKTVDFEFEEELLSAHLNSIRHPSARETPYTRSTPS